MSDYAIHKGRPVKKVKSVAGCQEVRLFDGNLIFAKDLQDVSKEEYERLVKEERAEKERLSKRDGFATEIIYEGSGWTNAATERGR